MAEYIKIVPQGGWHAFMQGSELLDYLMQHVRRGGWHYIGPTSNTAVFEAPSSGGCVYLELVEEAIVDAVLYPPVAPADSEFERVSSELMRRFLLEAKQQGMTHRL